jgi:hypothetical protein
MNDKKQNLSSLLNSFSEAYKQFPSMELHENLSSVVGLKAPKLSEENDAGEEENH